MSSIPASQTVFLAENPCLHCMRTTIKTRRDDDDIGATPWQCYWVAGSTRCVQCNNRNDACRTAAAAMHGDLLDMVALYNRAVELTEKKVPDYENIDEEADSPMIYWISEAGRHRIDTAAVALVNAFDMAEKHHRSLYSMGGDRRPNASVQATYDATLMARHQRINIRYPAPPPGADAAAMDLWEHRRSLRLEVSDQGYMSWGLAKRAFIDAVSVVLRQEDIDSEEELGAVKARVYLPRV